MSMPNFEVSDSWIQARACAMHLRPELLQFYHWVPVHPSQIGPAILLIEVRMTAIFRGTSGPYGTLSIGERGSCTSGR
jgi:hypothetical protein